MAQMPKNLNKKVIEGFLLLLVNSGEIIPENAYCLNKKKTGDSPYTGFLNERIEEVCKEVFSGTKETDKTITGNMG